MAICFGVDLILSIESSCDDSSIAVTELSTKKLLFHKKISQDAEHSPFGGVVPELASRLHANALPKLLEDAKEFLPHLKAVAVTNEPGLIVSLAGGVAMAKMLGLSLNIPIIPVNHLLGHIFSLFIEKEATLPLTTLLVSGGHTQIMRADEDLRIETVAKTMDDSFGESFDKTAKMLGLGYPGGPEVEKAAKNGRVDRFSFGLPLHNKQLAFSFSGLKNAVRLKVAEFEPRDEQTSCDIAAAFQKTAVEHILQKCRLVIEQTKPVSFAIVGGAAANEQLRESLLHLCQKNNAHLLLPNLEYCSDNAAMIGRAALWLFAAGAAKKYDEVDTKATSSI